MYMYMYHAPTEPATSSILDLWVKCQSHILATVSQKCRILDTYESYIKTASIIWLQVLVLIVLKKGLRWYEAPVDITIMWIKVHYNYFHCFKILQYFTKPCFKIFWKGKFIKAPAAFIIVTYRKVVIYKALTHCAMMLGNNFWRENYYKIMIDFIVYFDIKCVRIRMCVLYHLTMVEESTINLFFCFLR